MKANDGLYVGWLSSLSRMGSSVTAYAAAHPWSIPVADEILAIPRTGDPYHYPAPQAKLPLIYANSNYQLTPEIANLLTELFERISGQNRFIISKNPYWHPTPSEIASVFPSHRVVMLIRNPLFRVNSYFHKNQPFHEWGGPFEIDLFRSYARRWMGHPHRVIYDDLHHDPELFFGTIWRSWGVKYGPSDIERAIAYQRHNYHVHGRLKDSSETPESVLSERDLILPAAAIDRYLGDEFIRDFMASCGWSTHPDDYLPKNDSFGDLGQAE